MSLSPTNSPPLSRAPSPIESEGSNSSDWSTPNASFRSTRFGSTETPFTIFTSWTLEHVDRDLAKIDFSMVLKRDTLAEDVAALAVEDVATEASAEESMAIPEEEGAVALTAEEIQIRVAARAAQALVKLERAGEQEIEVDFKINGNLGHGAGTLTGRSDTHELLSRKIKFNLQTTSNNPVKEGSPKAMEQQQKILQTLESPEGLYAYEANPIFFNGESWNLCLEKRVIDPESDYVDDERTTFLVFSEGISNPLAKSDQERFELMLQQNVYGESRAMSTKANQGAITQLVKLYRDGQLVSPALTHDEILGHWDTRKVNGEYSGSFVFGFKQLEDGSFATNREYLGSDLEDGANLVSRGTGITLDGISVGTTTESTGPLPSTEPVFHNFLFWDGPNVHSPLTAEEQIQAFVDNPPVVISRSPKHLLFLTANGDTILLARNDSLGDFDDQSDIDTESSSDEEAMLIDSVSDLAVDLKP